MGDARRCEPDRDTYLIVMSSCDHCGHSEYAQTLWDTDVAAVGLRHVPHLVAADNDCLPRRGELLRSLRLIEQFEAERKERRHRNDEAMWNALLSGCRLHNDREMALGVFAEIRRRRFSERTMVKAAVSMRNLWAFQMKEEGDGGLLDGDGHRRFEAISAEIRDRGWDRFKTSAVSEFKIESECQPHAFYAGDGHLRSDEYAAIEDAMAELLDPLRANGYAPDLSVVTRRLREGELARDAVLRHSEKLTVVYGVMRTEEGHDIVVHKNLRICSDCHSFMKALSKVTGRVLTISDSYRVHQFVHCYLFCE